VRHGPSPLSELISRRNLPVRQAWKSVVNGDPVQSTGRPPMARLRLADLVGRGIVRNRVTLSNWINKHGFPRGQMTGPNTRTWDEETDLNPWLASRPTEVKATPRSPGRPRKHKAERATTEVEA